jgi:DNA-binding IclR family transcriptional regulator
MPISPSTRESSAPQAATAQLVPAVARALTLLNRLAQRRESMSLTQLTSELALPKSSVHGLCNTLMAFGYLRRQPGGAFLIGPRVMSLAESFVADTDEAQEFNALWAGGSTLPEETIVLSVLNEGDALYLAARKGTRPLGLAFNVGTRLPAYLSGSGKAILAFRDPDEVRRLYADGMSARLTNNAPRDIDALQKELAQTRKRGYSIDDETVREGVYSIGAPVFDATGRAVAGIAVCINKAGLGPDRGRRHREEALDVARRLSQRLGGEVPGDAANWGGAGSAGKVQHARKAASPATAVAPRKTRRAA